MFVTTYSKPQHIPKCTAAEKSMNQWPVIHRTTCLAVHRGATDNQWGTPFANNWFPVNTRQVAQEYWWSGNHRKSGLQAYPTMEGWSQQGPSSPVEPRSVGSVKSQIINLNHSSNGLNLPSWWKVAKPMLVVQKLSLHSHKAAHCIFHIYFFKKWELNTYYICHSISVDS